MGYTQILSEIPAKITAGTSVAWAVSLADFPASSGWTLIYTLVSPSAQVSVASTPSDDLYLFEIPYTDTSAWGAGKYAWQSHIANGTERYMIGTGTVDVIADFAEATTGHDARPWHDKAIEALEAAIAGRAGKTQLTQVLPNGLQVQHLKLSEQIAALKSLKEIRARAWGKSGFGVAKVRF